MPTKQKILITVMTYPHPSEGYQELVCTAGINEAKEWVRLYPVDYRYRPRGQQFRKYQWIEVDSDRPDKDNRPESWRPDLDSIKILGEPIPTKNQWRDRREIIDSMPHHTVNELKALWDQDKTSLGIVRPAKVIDMEIRKQEGDWKPKWQALFSQMRLFGQQQKPLTKLPYSFHYHFECEVSVCR